MLEDYGLLYRLTESGEPTKITVQANSKELGVVPTFNTLAEIKGTEKPDEYVMLSAHFDSWDGATGATGQWNRNIGDDGSNEDPEKSLP
ncbi:MAG: M28 family peptidase [Bacteroidota bacterium]